MSEFLLLFIQQIRKLLKKKWPKQYRKIILLHLKPLSEYNILLCTQNLLHPFLNHHLQDYYMVLNLLRVNFRQNCNVVLLLLEIDA